jgi:hypothetical protein
LALSYISIFKINAIAKNTAPQKHGVKNGFAAFTGQPFLHFLPCFQAINSDKKLYQAKTVPPRRTKNWILTMDIKFII